MSVSTQTRQEHRELLRSINDLIHAHHALKGDVRWGNSTYLPDTEILDFLQVQVDSLSNITQNVLGGHYRDAYNNIRMVFEMYLLLTLITMGDRYKRIYKIRRAPGDRSLDQARERFEQSVHQVVASGKRSDIVGVHHERHSSNVALIHRGIRVVDQDGHPTGRIVPFYYSAWKHYDSSHHVIKSALKSKRFLLPNWKLFRSRRAKAAIDENKAIYKELFTIDKIVDNLCLNRILNQKTAVRVFVHYNFLSGYSHNTNRAWGSLARQSSSQVTYNHYHSELALLYVATLLNMHLSLTLRYFHKSRLSIRNERRMYRSLCATVDSKFSYFWFIFNDPHEYDRFQAANRKSDYRRGMIYRPEDIKSERTPYYYDQSPLERLRALHCSQQELTTGNEFTSPFPRGDA